MLAAGLVVCSTAISAQVPDSLRRPGGMRGRPGALGGGRKQQQTQGGRPLDDNRPMERRVQQAIAQQMRRQLNLDDERMRQLQRTTTKFENERRQLLRDEREARQTLRAALEDSAATADQTKIEQAMGRMIQVQRKRVDILESEQKDLAAFLTPRQRAQYFALRERITRRLMELEQSGGGRRGGPPPVPR
jgi:hypothetical protein